jgi:hypothetical protein
MAIIDTILSTPVDVRGIANSDKGAELTSRLNGAFSNLLSYAKTHWSYTASGSLGGQALLDGTGTAAPCGGIATALKLVFLELGVPPDAIEYIRVTGYLWTGPEYLCFDPKVYGNVRQLDGRDYRNGCIFNEHYYLKCNNTYYDPCLSTAYAARDQSIKAKFTKSFSIGGPGNQRKFLVSPDNRTCFLYMRDEPVPGFQGAYAMFPATRKNIEKVLGKEFKTEMEAMRGTSSFAVYVKSLG